VRADGGKLVDPLQGRCRPGEEGRERREAVVVVVDLKKERSREPAAAADSKEGRGSRGGRE
jgi:hypothetical protein